MIEYPLKVYVDDDYRENLLRSVGKLNFNLSKKSKVFPFSPFRIPFAEELVKKIR